MNRKETICYSNDELIEKIAHESAMASAIPYKVCVNYFMPELAKKSKQEDNPMWK